MAAAAEAGDVQLVDINFVDSKIIVGDGGKFVVYIIRSKASNPGFRDSFCFARRRYSEFVQLKELLESRQEIEIPLFQSVNVSEDELDESFRERRKKDVQEFIEQILQNPNLKADDCVYLFLQTDYSMSVIQKAGSGKFKNGNKEASSHDKPSSNGRSSAANGSK